MVRINHHLDATDDKSYKCKQFFKIEENAKHDQMVVDPKRFIEHQIDAPNYVYRFEIKH